MICMIIYLLGVLMAVLGVMDIARTGEFGIAEKIIISAVTLIFSWIGVFAYFYAVKPIILKTKKD